MNGTWLLPESRGSLHGEAGLRPRQDVALEAARHGLCLGHPSPAISLGMGPKEEKTKVPAE